jgi:hypothetical protein
VGTITPPSGAALASSATETSAAPASATITDASGVGVDPSVPVSGAEASIGSIAASGETQAPAMQSNPLAQSNGLEHAVRQLVTPQA